MRFFVITIFSKSIFFYLIWKPFPFYLKSSVVVNTLIILPSYSMLLGRKVNFQFLFLSFCVPTFPENWWAWLFFKVTLVNLVVSLKHIIFLSFPSKICHLSSLCFRGKKIFLGEPASNHRENKLSKYKHLGFLEKRDVFL